jgi:hypothetical protein
MSNMPTIKFYINSSTTPTIVTPTTINPLVFNCGSGITSTSNWYYYLIKSDGFTTYDININVTAAPGYSLPVISFVLTGSGGRGGPAGANYGTSQYKGGNGGGGGGGSVSLINNYYSGVNSTWHEIKLYPIASYASVMYLDDNGIAFYASTGGSGGGGANGSNKSSGDSANGANGGNPSALKAAPTNSLPSYSGIIRGGAGGNAGARQPTNDNNNQAGASYYGATPAMIGASPTAYVPVTFADGLISNIVNGGAGGAFTATGDPQPGQSGPPSMFMLYFSL